MTSEAMAPSQDMSDLEVMDHDGEYGGETLAHVGESSMGVVDHEVKARVCEKALRLVYAVRKRMSMVREGMYD